MNEKKKYCGAIPISTSINPVTIVRMLRNESYIVGKDVLRTVTVQPLVSHKFYFIVTPRLPAVELVMTAHCTNEMHILCEARAIRHTNCVSVAK